MKRIIKFRVWTGDNIIMNAHIGMGSINTLIKEAQKDWIFMQFTGLSDRLGKEIYEGDIVRLRDEMNFKTQIGGYWSSEGTGYGVHFLHEGENQKDEIIMTPFGFEQEKELEIIGNIYEDEGLLNK